MFRLDYSGKELDGGNPVSFHEHEGGTATALTHSQRDHMLAVAVFGDLTKTDDPASPLFFGIPHPVVQGFCAVAGTTTPIGGFSARSASSLRR